MNAECEKSKNVFVRFFKYLTPYERIWLFGITLLAVVMAIIFPEDDVTFYNSADVPVFVSSGFLITVLYVFDVIIGNFCELLFSKQNKWGFLIYNIVELIEIACLLLTGSRFASLAVCIFYWIPAHTMGFVFWNRHKDKKDKRKTVVRLLKPWQTVLIFVFTIVGTFGVGYIVARISPDTDFYSSDTVAKLVAYLDASLAIMSIIDGVLMFFRSKESWWTWYIYIAVETVVNIISGQWILLVYKLGYVTNTTYGMILWSKYIKENRTDGKTE